MPTIQHIQQHNEYGCGAACLAMVCQYYDTAVSQEEMYAKLEEDDPEVQSAKRISSENLVAYAKQHGFVEAVWQRCPTGSHGEMQQHLLDKLRKHGPLILCIQSSSNKLMGHFVVASTNDSEHLIINDPLKDAPHRESWTKLRRRWQNTGSNVTGGVYINIGKKQESKPAA